MGLSHQIRLLFIEGFNGVTPSEKISRKILRAGYGVTPSRQVFCIGEGGQFYGTYGVSAAFSFLSLLR